MAEDEDVTEVANELLLGDRLRKSTIPEIASGVIDPSIPSNRSLHFGSTKDKTRWKTHIMDGINVFIF